MHWLMVPERWDRRDADGGMEVWHEGCGDVDSCPVTTEHLGSGLSVYFLHRADSESITTGYQERLAPGVYPLEAWSEKVRDDSPMGPAEYDGGLRLLDERPDEGPPESRLDPGTAWVWLSSVSPPRYEVRGDPDVA